MSNYRAERARKLSTEFHNSKRYNECKERDNFTCQRCGRMPPSVKVLAHHIISLMDGGDNRLANITTLCTSCHHYIHSYFTPPDEYLSEKRMAEFLSDHSDISSFLQLLELRRQMKVLRSEIATIKLRLLYS